MKKLLLLVLLTSMFGTAHATRSRMASLSQPQNQGSFYLMDNRDFFRNPANAAKMRNFMVAELGNGSAAGAGNNLEGGYFGEFSSDMAYGVYLGKQAVVNDVAAKVTSASVLSGLPADYWPTSGDANPLNLFFEGGSDMKWGVNINYADSQNKESNGKDEYNSLGLAAGIETSGGLQVYASYLGDESKTATTTNYNSLKSSPFNVGIIYGLNAETTVWVQYGAGTTKATGPTKTEVKFDSTQMVLGIGRIYELSPTARFNFDLSWNMAQTENKNATSGLEKANKNTLPIVVGLEADAAEWLILRASVTQNFILGNYKLYTKGGGTSESTTDVAGTNVAIGGTLHFGKLKIDGNLGAGNTATQPANSLFDSNSFFGQAAVTYMF